MTYARKTQVSLKDTPYYHVVARCVRRAWLYGYDEYAGKDYSHRKDWVIDRMRELALMFAIDVCAYAIMSNHYHLVLFIDALRARDWSDEEVIRRWGSAIFDACQSTRCRCLRDKSGGKVGVVVQCCSKISG